MQNNAQFFFAEHHEKLLFVYIITYYFAKTVNVYSLTEICDEL